MTDTKKLLEDLDKLWIDGGDEAAYNRLRAALESLAAKEAEVERLGNSYQVKLDDHAKDMSCIEAALNRAGIGLGTTPYQAERGIETAACVDSLRTRADELAAQLAAREADVEALKKRIEAERDAFRTRADELAARCEALEEAATCACGDQFNTNFRGICPNCDCANRSGMLDRDALAAHDRRLLEDAWKRACGISWVAETWEVEKRELEAAIKGTAASETPTTPREGEEECIELPGGKP